MSKVSYVVKMRAQPGKRDDLLAGLADLVKEIADEEGTELYIFHADDNDPDAVWSYEIFRDADAVAIHQANQGVAAFGDTLGPLLDGAPEPIRLRPVVGKGFTP